MDKELKLAGLTQGIVDKYLYYNINGDKITLLLLYVDDIGLASNDDDLTTTLKARLGSVVRMKDLGNIINFIGAKIEQKDNGISMDQHSHILKALETYGMRDCKPVNTPIDCSDTQRKDDDEAILDSNYPFRALVGSLNYIAQVSRPDICFTVNKLSRKLEKPNKSDWRVAKGIL